MSAAIRVNGAPRPLTAATVAELLREEAIDLEARGIAVALNGRVAPRHAWAETTLKAGDEVEIVKPFKGG